MSEQQEDARVFGEGVIVYCDQHLRPHFTGWCGVDVRHKTKLEATELMEAAEECRRKGFKLYGSLPD